VLKLQGWRSLGAGLIAGALAALAMPPLYWLPLAVVGLVVLVWLWDDAPTARIAALRAWFWGIGHFTVALTKPTASRQSRRHRLLPSRHPKSQ